VKRSLKILILTVFMLLSACKLFLGHDPDTSPEEILKSLWNDFNNIHANLDFRMCTNLKFNSWYDVYHNEQTGYSRNIYPGISEESLFSVCADMLMELNDPHTGLYAPGKFESSYVENNPDIFSLSGVRRYLSENGNDDYLNFLFGNFSSVPEIGYIHIALFTDETSPQENQEWGRAIDKIINSLENTNAIVLDIRGNRGGEVFVMEYIAARFVSEQKDYLKTRAKTGPGINDFSGGIIYTVKPIRTVSDNRFGYTKPIVLLTNKGTVSAAEWFTMALRTQSHVTHTGTPTCGAFSSRCNRFMINGWIYSISPERVSDMNGKYYEGIGISPDKEHIIVNTPDDEQLQYALELALGAK
jgi:C-terminal processing protease CtpA/Prc